MASVPNTSCAIARSLGVLGERWTLLVLRDAFDGLRRFEQFRASLGIASDVLSARLATLVEYGVLAKVDYQEQGARRRHEYVLTDAGRELLPVLAALQEWGDRHLPRDEGPSVVRRERGGGEVRVGFVNDAGRAVTAGDLDFVRTAAYPADRRRLLDGQAGGRE
jgi:DNA-binding HxlR family transcriptional regulator